MTDKPTREEHAAALAHDPSTCHVCNDPHRHGEQAPTEEEREIDQLRAEVERLKEFTTALSADLGVSRAEGATLTAERDNALAGIESIRATLDAVVASHGRATDRLVAEKNAAAADRDAALAERDHARFDGANGERARLLAENHQLRTKYARECREEEREACAALVEAGKWPASSGLELTRHIAAAIRARKS